jgi:hypothetical protein
LWAAGILILIVFIAAVVVSFMPIVSVPVETTETYYEEEVRQESYTIKEEFVKKEPRQKSAVIVDGYHTSVPAGVEFPFTIDKPDTRLTGKYRCPVPASFHIIHSPTSHILHEILGEQSTFEFQLPEGEYRARIRENKKWDIEIYIRLALEWTELEEVTEYREVTKYRDVPFKVEKQRTIITEIKISWWKLVFGD